jgi:hypothetical protein
VESQWGMESIGLQMNQKKMSSFPLSKMEKLQTRGEAQLRSRLIKVQVKSNTVSEAQVTTAASLHNRMPIKQVTNSILFNPF